MLSTDQWSFTSAITSCSNHCFPSDVHPLLLRRELRLPDLITPQYHVQHPLHVPQHLLIRRRRPPLKVRHYRWSTNLALASSPLIQRPQPDTYVVLHFVARSFCVIVVPLSFFAAARAAWMASPTFVPIVFGLTMSSERSTLVRCWPSIAGLDP